MRLPSVRRERLCLCTELRLGVSLTALTLALAGTVILPDRAEATCSITGSVILYQCNNGGVNAQPDTVGGTTLLVANQTITGWINYSIAPTVTTGPLSMQLTVANSSVTAVGNGAVNVSSQSLPATINVSLGADVALENTGGSGGLWVRNQIGGDITIVCGASIISRGSDAISATTNAGAVSITHTGNVSSSDNRGIYADGGFASASPVTVSVNNSGLVNAYLAGIRVVDYLGTASLQNSATVPSRTMQALVAWSQSGDVSIDNSGSVLASNYIGVHAMADAGNITVANSGYIQADRDTSIGPSTTNQGISAEGSNNVSITNTATGRVAASADTGIAATTANGTITISYAGRVTGTAGVSANATIGAVSVTNTGTITGTSGAGVALVSGNGAVSFTNSRIVSATGLGVSLNGTTNTLANTGTISTTGTTAVQTGNGNSTVTVSSGSIAANSAADTAIAMGSGSNLLVLGDAATLVGKVTNASTSNTLELTGTAAGTLSGIIGAAGTYQGFANLTKSGTGTWTLTGLGSGISGTAAIGAGTLSLQGGLSAGAVTVGGASAATLAIGAGGMLSTAGATVGSSGGATAALTISGTGATWIDSGETTIGTNGTTGSVLVSNGGQMTSRRMGITTPTWLSGSGGTASLTVTGAGSTWTNTGSVDLARTAGSTGSLTVSAGATAHIYNTGIYTGVGTRVEIGNPADSTQAAWLSPAGGSITVSDGTSLYTSGTYVGAGTSSVGSPVDPVTMTVTGTGTTWNGGERIYVGGQNGGVGDGIGTLTVAGGAIVTTATIGIGMTNSTGACARPLHFGRLAGLARRSAAMSIS